MHATSHGGPGAGAAQDYLSHQPHYSATGHSAYASHGYADHVNGPTSGSEQGSESVAHSASQHDSEGAEIDDRAENEPVKLFVGQVRLFRIL